MASNFYSGIYHHLSENPDKVFLKWPAKSDTYSQFSGKAILEKVAFVCKALEDKKIRIDEKVFIGVPFSPELVFAVLGIMAYGAIPVLPPAATTKMELFKQLLQKKIKVVYFKNPPIFIKLFLALFGIKAIFQSSNFKNITDFKPTLVSEDQAALISFSSGSTGKPRAVYRSHKILNSQHLALKKSFPPMPGQQDFPIFPNILLHNLSLGIATVIPEIPNFDIRLLEPQKVLKQIVDEDVDSLTGNVFYFKKLLKQLQHTGQILPGVKEIGIGGSPVPEYLPQLLKSYFVNAVIYIIYGSTQAEPIAVRTVREHKNPALGYFVGAVHPDIELWIDSSQKIKAGKYKFPSGLIYVKGKHVVLEKDQEWLNTGDYGYLDRNSDLYLTGRQGNETQVQGYGHYQIENVLNSLPQIKQVAAIANTETFDIFYEGEVKPATIREKLKMFPVSIIGSIKSIKEMPLDKRHHSKILYHNLCTPNLKT
ncbi:AMP-binding protein [Gramella sp. AN32]|uniref:AMP-binding protein n=1 Tax=Christiangramia antarctica TaxID=2058158 RepID=A0ABW5X9V8_9FLAO|nr:AMP-binding protein [Gramella sp. AN32]MCM4156001.1 hypothetical protein [Gramella sp. AN32]